MKGKLIVIEGLDGSGKATQTDILCNNLKNIGVQAENYSFPDYESESSLLVRMYLDGKFGDDPNSVNPYTASCFFACDRYASFKTKWHEKYENGQIIICDRYTTSNAVHQCSKLSEKEWDGFMDWLYDFEYQKIGIPAPDCVIYLRVDPEVGQKLLSGRYKGDDEKKDIHEKNVDYLKRSRTTADYCAKRCGWHTVECVENGSMRSPEDIGKDVFDIVKKILCI